MMITSRAIAGGMLLIAAVASSGARSEAAEWSAEPSLTLRGVYNSNLLLTSLPARDTWGYWVSPGVKFAGATENLEVSGKAGADFVSYYGGVDQSITNMDFPLSMKYRTERETFGLDGGFTRDNTLMGELQQTGVVLSFTQRNYWNITPSWAHALTERLSLQGTYQYADAKYENGARLGLVDYVTHSGSAGLSYRLTDKDQVQAMGIVTDFQAPQASNLRSGIWGGQVTWSHDLTESLNANLSAGGRFVSSSIDDRSSRLTDSQVVWVGNARLQKRWEDVTAKIEASRDVFPSGFGLLLQTSRVGVGLYKELSERITVSLDAAVLFATPVTSKVVSFTFPENRYITATPGVRWRFSEWWAVDASYTYAQRHVASPMETAVSNAATIMVTYFPPKLTVGR